MTSSSTSDGADDAERRLQAGHRSRQCPGAGAEPRRLGRAAPARQVRQLGVVTNKNSPDILLVIFLASPDGTFSTRLYLATTPTCRSRTGWRDSTASAASTSSARAIIRCASGSIPTRRRRAVSTRDDIVTALRAQNVQVAAGSIGAPPFGPGGSGFELNIQTEGRLTTHRRVRRHRHQVRRRAADPGARRGAGRDRRAGLQHRASTTTGCAASASASPSGRARTRWRPPTPSSRRWRTPRRTSRRASIYQVPYNPTEYVRASVESVQQTLIEAILLVVLVVLVFLQSWRAAIIPIIAIPVSLVGTFAVMAGFGYSLNTLSLFGLVLAIGIVVDDAIVVVENVERELALGHVAARCRLPDDGRGRRRADRHRAGAVRGVRADRLHQRHFRAVLPAVRGDHFGGDADLAASSR